MTIPNTELSDGVSRIFTPVKPVAWRVASGGYSPAERWVVEFDDGSAVFVKSSMVEMLADWIRAEHNVYTQIHEDYMPRLLGWDDDGERPILVLENLEEAHWPPPWSTAQVEGVVSMLDRVHATTPPEGIPSTPRVAVDGWAVVANDPTEFLSLNLCSSTWLEHALPDLLASEEEAPVYGDSFSHIDVRSDNLCFTDDRVLLVDWNGSCKANGLLDLAFWLPSLESEGGPRPEEVSQEASVLAGMVSGFFASRAGGPIIKIAPRVRIVQLAQLRTALPWAVRTLGLPPLD